MTNYQYIKRLFIGLILLTLVCLANNSLKAQTDPLKGLVNSSGKVSIPGGRKGSSNKFTGYFLDSQMPNDSIWMSKNGKYFVKRISKKSGNVYHKYLDIGEKPLKDTTKPKNNG